MFRTVSPHEKNRRNHSPSIYCWTSSDAMSALETSSWAWLRWWLLPLKVFVLLALPLVFLSDSPYMPWLTPFDMSLDMFVGWLCLLCFLVFLIAAIIQRLVGPPRAARWSILFAVLSLILGAILSPLFAVE
jgi:hypothetical protein